MTGFTLAGQISAMTLFYLTVGILLHVRIVESSVAYFANSLQMAFLSGLGLAVFALLWIFLRRPDEFYKGLTEIIWFSIPGLGVTLPCFIFSTVSPICFMTVVVGAFTMMGVLFLVSEKRRWHNEGFSKGN